MILYEVNIQVRTEIYTAFYQWLEQHIQDMLKLPNFDTAKLFVGEENETEKELVVHYHLKDRSAINHYLEELAPKMRSDAPKEFDSSFQIHRRILEYVHQ
jgi:hypothetical protein